MTSWFAPLFAAALLAQTPPAGGQVPARLTLDDAVRKALAHDPSVGAARASAAAASAATGEARAAWLPTLTLTAAATQYQLPMLVTPIHGFTPGLTPPFDETLIQAGAQLSYTLFDGGARSARIRASRAGAEAGDAGRVQAEQRLISQVLSLYVQVLGGAELLTAHNRRMEALTAEQGRARLRFETGRAATVDVLRVDAAVAQAEAERVRIGARLDAAERDLARVIGLPVNNARARMLVRVLLRDSVIPAREASLPRALVANSALAQARDDSAAGAAASSLAKSARWPRLDLAGAYVDRGSVEGHFGAEWNVGLQLTYPVFRGGAVSSNIARAVATERALGLRARAAEAQTARELDAVYATLDEARARVTHLETAVARFTEVVRIEALRLDTGAGTQTDYLTAQAELLSAQAGLVEAQYGLIVTRAELARVTGDLAGEWLTRFLGSVQ